MPAPPYSVAAPFSKWQLPRVVEVMLNQGMERHVEGVAFRPQFSIELVVVQFFGSLARTANSRAPGVN